MLRFFLLALTVLMSVTVTADPKWYSQSDALGYKASQYYIGLGKGNTYDEAIGYAQADLAGQIVTKVTSEVSIRDQETSSLGYTNTQKDMQSRLQTTVSGTIKNTQIVKQVHDGPFYYAAVVLKKSTYISGLKQELALLEKDYKTQAELIKSDKDKQRFRSVIVHYNSLLSIARDIEKLTSIYIYLEESTESSQFSYQKTKKNYSTFLSQFSLSIKNNNQQEGVSGQLLPKDITVSVLYNKNLHKEFGY